MGGKVTHGMAKQGRVSSEYYAYQSARKRCTNPKLSNWPFYGGRGIEFRFSNFEEFIAALGPKPSPLHTLDRIHNDGHYEGGNVRWATRRENCHNRRNSRRMQPNYVNSIEEHFLSAKAAIGTCSGCGTKSVA